MKADFLKTFHDSQNLRYRRPFGAVPAGQPVMLALKVQSAHLPDKVVLRLWSSQKGEETVLMLPDSKHKEEGSVLYTAEIIPDRPCLLWYYFIVHYRGALLYYSRLDDRYGGRGCLCSRPMHSYQITVYKPDFKLPRWYREGVLYQIFPDRFYRGQTHLPEDYIKRKEPSIIIHENWDETPLTGPDPKTGEILNNDFFCGNLQGIIEKLDYLKELGITVLYLNPIFEAYSNHRYDTGDYKKLDPLLGDLDVFRQLCNLAEERGISIMLDGVFSHTGSDSLYFNKEGHYPGIGAWQSKDSPYYSWYRFKSFPDDYDCWWGIKTLPNVNETDPSYMDFVINRQDSVVRYWLNQGAAGWRLDVADELPNTFLKELRKAVKETKPQAVIIGEVWEDASNKVSYGILREYLLGEELDSVMNYPFRSMVLDFLLGFDDGEGLYRGSMTLYENYPKEAFFGTMNLLGTHDVTRLRTILGEAPAESELTRREQAEYCMTKEQKALASRRQRLATVLQMTMPGVPSIYYGDEAGMEGYRDPLNRGTYPWGREDMSMIEWYKRLIRIRHQEDALKKGEYIPIYYEGGVYGFLRQIKESRDVFGEYAENQLLLILVNRNGYECTATISLGESIGEQAEEGIFKDILNKNMQHQLTDGCLSICLDPFDSLILKWAKEA